MTLLFWNNVQLAASFITGGISAIMHLLPLMDVHKIKETSQDVYHFDQERTVKRQLSVCPRPMSVASKAKVHTFSIDNSRPLGPGSNVKKLVVFFLTGTLPAYQNMCSHELTSYACNLPIFIIREAAVAHLLVPLPVSPPARYPFPFFTFFSHAWMLEGFSSLNNIRISVGRRSSSDNGRTMYTFLQLGDYELSTRVGTTSNMKIISRCLIRNTKARA